MNKTRTELRRSAPGIELAGTVSLRSHDKNWGSERRMSLLAAIGDQGSITAAAKKVGLSYKAAWDAVDAMNNLAGEPLVVRTTGGQRGGGATLTARAIELVELYEKVSREHERFMARLAKSGSGDSRNLEIIGHMAIRTSARNSLAGTVREIKAGAVNDEVILGLGNGHDIVASVTSESVASLDLRPGRRAIAMIKASSVMIGEPSETLRLSARNQLQGRISRIVRGAVNADVCVELAQGSVIAAVVSLGGIDALGLEEHSPAVALFKASSVILGVMD